MQSQVDWLDSGGGHITVALFVFLVGVGLLLARIDVGKEIVVGALASLWTSLRNANRESPPTQSRLFPRNAPAFPTSSAYAA